jgi:hypothetical protein
MKSLGRRQVSDKFKNFSEVTRSAKMKFILQIILLFLFCSLASAQAEIKTVDALLNQLRAEANFSGNVLIAEKGKVFYEKSFGGANAGTKTPLTKGAICLTRSVAKTFTAALDFRILTTSGIASAKFIIRSTNWKKRLNITRNPCS